MIPETPSISQLSHVILQAAAPPSRWERSSLDALYALVRRIRKANTEAELGMVEDEIDEILKEQRAKAAAGDETAVDAATLNVAAHRLENLIHDRRHILASGNVVATSG